MTDGSEHSRVRSFLESTPGSEVALPYAGFETFLKSKPTAIDDLEGVDAAVIGIPYDGAVSNRPGARYGPRELRRASGWLAYLSGYKGGLTNMRTGKQVNFDALNLVDCGDLPVFPMDVTKTAESITAHVGAIAADGVMPVVLGGDHYCTFPAVRGFAAGGGYDRVGLVQIDAHTDTVAESPVLGSHFHGSSTHHITQSAHTDLADVAQVGIRGYESPEFFSFSQQEGLGLFTIGEIESRGIQAVVEDAIAHAAADTDVVYVTFDIDAIDPSAAPGTGTPEPGGLSASQALTVMETLGAHDAVGAVDLMEVAPPIDPGDETARLGAYLLTTFLERQFAESAS